jgi:hypothetical protein
MFVSYEPSTETYRFYKHVEKLKIWDCHERTSVFSEFERNQFEVVKLKGAERELIRKRYLN